MCSSPRETLLPEIRQKNQKMIIWLCQKILIKIWSKRGGPDSPPPPPPPKKKKKKKIWILCQNSRTRELKIRVVGFVLKKLLTYFEMLIVPHALQCVDGCFGPVFTASTSIWQRPYCEGILLSYGRILPRLRCSCWHGSDLDHVTQLFWTISSQLYVNSTCNIKLKLFNITWIDLVQYVQRCPRMFRCWQQITHPFSFSEAIKEKYSHTDRCWARNMQWIFRDFQELNPAVYYFCLFIF